MVLRNSILSSAQFADGPGRAASESQPDTVTVRPGAGVTPRRGSRGRRARDARRARRAAAAAAAAGAAGSGGPGPVPGPAVASAVSQAESRRTRSQ
jgi:hypothetical protein